MAGNHSITQFFKPAQPAAKLPAPSPAPAQPASAFKVPSAPSVRAGNVPKPSNPQMEPNPTPAPKSLDQTNYTSSLSPPPSSDASEEVPSKTPQPTLPTNISTREIKGSDDEDSDSSLEDLTTIFAARSSSSGTRKSGDGYTPYTPAPPRRQTRKTFHKSPLAVSKYSFDLNLLVSHNEEDDAAELSAKRFKAMMQQEAEDEKAIAQNGDDVKSSKFAHSALLESVVAEREDGGADKVSRAIERTEATVTQMCWYFFEIDKKRSKQTRKPFPVASIQEDWEDELADPQMRQQSFMLGFVEDLAAMGKALPDELFLWILDEACLEPLEPLRISYFNVFRQCHEQLHRLITPDAIKSMFRRLGGRTQATTVTEDIATIQKLDNPYSHRDWGKLLSVIKFFGQTAKLLQQKSRTYMISMLLRLSVDNVVFENVDIHDSVQETISRLSRYIPDEDWSASCSAICKPLFDSISQATLRLQIIDSISSITPRTHELRRRLAMTFFFDDLSYSSIHPHTSINIDNFITRLSSPAFSTEKKDTDWRELTALVHILDVAADDGRHADLDLTDKTAESDFNEDIEELSKAVGKVMKSMGTKGVGFISKVEAKAALDLVAQRFIDTMRTKPRPKHTWFDGDSKKKEEDLAQQRKGMASFLSKVSGSSLDVKKEVSSI